MTPYSRDQTTANAPGKTNLYLKIAVPILQWTLQFLKSHFFFVNPGADALHFFTDVI